MRKKKTSKTLKRLFVLFLCMALAASNVGYISVMAETDEDVTGYEEVVEDDSDSEAVEEIDETGEEIDETEDVSEEPQEEISEEEETPSEDTEEEPEPEPEPEEEAVKKMSASTDHVSFGTLEEGTSAEPISFEVRNEGNTDLAMKWSQSDSENVFTTDFSASTLGEQESATCTVYLKDGVSPGDYSATLLFQDEEDSDVNATVTVSVKIKEKKPEEKKEEKKEETPPAPKKEEKKATPKQPQKAPAKPKKKPAVKKEKTYQIKAKISPKDGGKVSGTGTFKKGQNTIVTAYAKKGFKFAGWFDGEGNLFEKRDSFVINDIKKSASYTAKFKRKYCSVDLKNSDSDLGTTYGSGQYLYGESVEIEAVPHEDAKFIGWYEDGERISKDQRMVLKNLKGNRTLKAVFRQKVHTITTSVYPAKAGEVTGKGEYKDGADVVLTAKANKGYVFKGYLLNNQVISVKKAYTIKKIDRDLSITAYFEKKATKQYKIVSGVANKGGSISPSGSLTIGEHGSITYTMSPDNGYAVQEVYVDGKAVGAKSSYTFKDIKKEHEISVVFAPKKNNEKQVKKDKVITKKEAAKFATMELYPASASDEKRSSDIVTPEMYKKMKSEGNLSDIILMDKQNIVGVDNADLPAEVDSYNYDEAVGIYQMTDVNPDEAQKMIETGTDKELVKTAYEAGYLNVMINNHYLFPNKEEEVNDVFEDNKTIDDMFKFINEVLTGEEKMELFSGQEYTVSIGITHEDELDEETKTKMEKAGVTIDEYFYITVNKQRGDEDPVAVEELQHPIRITMKQPDGKKANCVVHYHKGKVEVLEDKDNSDETITIETSSFSPYAFAKKSNTSSTPMIPIIIGSMVVLLLAGVVLMKNKKGEDKS